jgi:[protein-PII] uridylyltransferase
MRYLLGTPPSSVPHHLAAVRARGGARVHVELVPSRHDDMAELCVVAADQPGLLARIAAAVTAATLEVHAAQVHTRSTDGGVEAVDVFFVRDPVDGTAGVAKKLPRLRADLEDLCEGRGSPEELLEARTGSRSPWQRRPTPAVASEVVIDDRASPHHTIVEVFGKDQPGLLFRLARAFEELGLSIALSKINTEGTKVADVFYVNELNGSKVEGKERLSAVRDRLLREVA